MGFTFCSDCNDACRSERTIRSNKHIHDVASTWRCNQKTQPARVHCLSVTDTVANDDVAREIAKRKPKSWLDCLNSLKFSKQSRKRRKQARKGNINSGASWKPFFHHQPNLFRSGFFIVYKICRFFVYIPPLVCHIFVGKQNSDDYAERRVSAGKRKDFASSLSFINSFCVPDRYDDDMLLVDPLSLREGRLRQA